MQGGLSLNCPSEPEDPGPGPLSIFLLQIHSQHFGVAAGILKLSFYEGSVVWWEGSQAMPSLGWAAGHGGSPIVSFISLFKTAFTFLAQTGLYLLTSWNSPHSYLTLHTLPCGHQTFYSMTVDLEPSTAATDTLLRECGHPSAETRRPMVGKCPSISLSFMYAEACFLGTDSVFQNVLFFLPQMRTLLAARPPPPTLHLRGNLRTTVSSPRSGASSSSHQSFLK